MSARFLAALALVAAGFAIGTWHPDLPQALIGTMRGCA
jgi:hypothetical protein